MSNNTDRHLDDKIIRIKARFALLYCLGKANAHDREMKAQETYEPTAKLLELSKREQTIAIKEKNGVGEDRPWWPNVVQWARQKLKDVNTLGPSSHGYWRLSDKGKKQYDKLAEEVEGSELTFEQWVEEFVSKKQGRQ